MKKLCLILLLLLVPATTADTETVTLSTYYAAPFGSFDRLRLIPRDIATMVCDDNSVGTLVVDQNNANTIQYCQNGATWGPLPGVWTQDLQDNVMLANDDINGDVTKTFVGIGTSTPVFPLTLEGDGGILAKGVFNQGEIIPPDIPGSGDTKMVWYPRKSAFLVGRVDTAAWNNVNIGDYSFATGLSSEPRGNYSVAMGNRVRSLGNYSMAIHMGALATGNSATALHGEASGNQSMAFGIQAKSIGASSIAMGQNATASGDYSTVLGTGITASGDYSTAMGLAHQIGIASASGERSTSMGYETMVQAYASTAFGWFNVYSGDPLSWDPADPLFAIGNGTDDENRSNAMTILKNGKTGTRTANPSKHLYVDTVTVEANRSPEVHTPSLEGAAIEGENIGLQIIGDLNGTGASHLILSGAQLAAGDNKHWIISHWGLDRNNAFGIGYMESDADDFAIDGAYTNPALAILTSGYVGIGTNTPTQILHINDVLRLTPIDRVASPPACDAGGMGRIYADNTGALCFCDGSSWNIVATGAGGSCS